MDRAALNLCVREYGRANNGEVPLTDCRLMGAEHFGAEPGIAQSGDNVPPLCAIGRYDRDQALGMSTSSAEFPTDEHSSQRGSSPFLPDSR